MEGASRQGPKSSKKHGFADNSSLLVVELIRKETSGVDAFVICDDPTEGERSLQLLFKALQGTTGEHKLLVVRSNSAVTIFRENEPTFPIQLVLRTHKSIAGLLTGFDVDCCAIAYDPSAKKVWCTRCHRLPA